MKESDQEDSIINACLIESDNWDKLVRNQFSPKILSSGCVAYQEFFVKVNECEKKSIKLIVLSILLLAVCIFLNFFGTAKINFLGLQLEVGSSIATYISFCVVVSIIFAANQLFFSGYYGALARLSLFHQNPPENWSILYSEQERNSHLGLVTAYTSFFSFFSPNDSSRRATIFMVNLTFFTLFIIIIVYFSCIMMITYFVYKNSGIIISCILLFSFCSSLYLMSRSIFMLSNSEIEVSSIARDYLDEAKMKMSEADFKELVSDVSLSLSKFRDFDGFTPRRP